MAEYVWRLRNLVGGEELLQIPSVSIALRDGDGRVPLRNGHRTSYVTTVFSASLAGGLADPDPHEVLELRLVSEREASQLPNGAWVDEVLQAVFRNLPSGTFRDATWQP